jgi:excisionase family DNA binding protein
VKPRPALLLEVDGAPGVWLSASTARRYFAAMEAMLRIEARRHPGAARRPDDLIVTQALLKLGTATGTKVAGGNEPGTSSGVYPVATPLSVADAASLAGISDRGIRKAINARRLRADRVGRSWVIDRVDLQQFLQTREAAA